MHMAVTSTTFVTCALASSFGLPCSASNAALLAQRVHIQEALARFAKLQVTFHPASSPAMMCSHSAMHNPVSLVDFASTKLATAITSLLIVRHMRSRGSESSCHLTTSTLLRRIWLARLLSPAQTLL